MQAYDESFLARIPWEASLASLVSWFAVSVRNTSRKHLLQHPTQVFATYKAVFWTVYVSSKLWIAST